MTYARFSAVTPALAALVAGRAAIAAQSASTDDHAHAAADGDPPRSRSCASTHADGGIPST